MNRDEMLKALDLDAAPAQEESDAVQVESKTFGPTVSQEANAFRSDLWTKRQGRQLGLKLANEVYAGGAKRPVHELSHTDLADFHLGTFDPSPEMIDKDACSDKLKWRYFDELVNTPGFHELREGTILDDAASEVAIERLSEGLVNLRGEENGNDGSVDGSGDNEGDGGFKVGRAAGKAVNEAKKDVQDLNDAREGLGCGTEAGAGGSLDVKQAIELYKKLRKDANLQKIMNLTGKYRLFGQSQQRRKVEHGWDDMTNITVGGDLSKLVQSEFMALGIPELEDEVCIRLLNNNAMIQEWHGLNPVAKGPAIILLDESASMTELGADGCTRLQHAKAIALSFAYIARSQNRWCCLVAWSSGGQRRAIVLKPGKWDHHALIEWISGNFCGGTEPPIADMPAIYDSVGAPNGITDLAYITDGAVYIDESMISAFNEWKKTVNARVTTLAVSSGAGDMTKVSDEVHLIKSLGLNDAVGRVLSI